MNNTVVGHITSLNSKFFHLALVHCKRFRGSKLMISAPANSPNTDGIHIDRSSNIHLSRSHIQTGDDCISIGQGNSQVTITSINCGPGHGIRYIIAAKKCYCFCYLLTCIQQLKPAFWMPCVCCTFQRRKLGTISKRGRRKRISRQRL